jgi:serine protease inhibitor
MKFGYQLLITSLVVVGCGNQALSVEERRALPVKEPQPIATSSQAFAKSVMGKLQSKNPPSNFMISPWSLSNCIEMLRYGATGETERELRQFLGQSVDAKSAARQISRVMVALEPLVKADTFRHANGIWVLPKYPVQPNYLANTPKLFGATLKSSAMPEPAVSEINQFVNESTRGRIPKLFDSLSPDAFMVLVNAVSFKDKWYKPFDRSLTRPGMFTSVTGNKVTVPMMNQKDEFHYGETKEYQHLKLSYESGLQMSIILPRPGIPISNVLKLDMSLDQYLDDHKGTVTIPKWKQEFSLNLGDFMESMGCRTTFDPDKAQLGRIAKGAFVSQAVHKTFIEVDEAGTEAAAATGIAVAEAAAAPAEPFTFIADRPFAYYIHTTEGVVLFGGVVNDPSR